MFQGIMNFYERLKSENPAISLGYFELCLGLAYGDT